MLKILVLVGYYLPGYKAGGALRTIVNLIDQLSHEFDFRIITSDRDFRDDVPYPNIAIDQWNIIDKAQVLYVSPAKRTIFNLVTLINETSHDILYLNSFFDPVFVLRPLLARRMGKLPQRPTILAPRGEFSSGALNQKKWKKVPYRVISRAISLYEDLIWQASSDYEVADIRRVMGEVAKRITVAPDMPQLNKPMVNINKVRSRSTSEPLRICVLSRIVPIKNLDFSLHILKQVTVPVIFDIYGPKEDETYWELCNTLIKWLPSSVAVRYQGSVEHHRVTDILESYDLFFLPSKGENFGHTIIESMLAGTPVLIANTTPWRELEACGVGWDLSLDEPAAFATAIEKAASLDTAEYSKWRSHVRDYAIRVSYDNSALEANRQLFLNAVKCATAAG